MGRRRSSRVVFASAEKEQQRQGDDKRHPDIEKNVRISLQRRLAVDNPIQSLQCLAMGSDGIAAVADERGTKSIQTRNGFRPVKS